MDKFLQNNQVDLTILGSTGSIGRQALDVAKQHKETVRVIALTAMKSVDMLVQQTLEFGVKHIAIADESQKNNPSLADLPSDVHVEFGAGAIEELAACNPCSQGVQSTQDAQTKASDTFASSDIVLNSLVGAAGLRASYATLKAGRRLALANKESLVVGGELLMPMVMPSQLLPVDSEHSAIFQCMLGESEREVSRIWITASGGPFRGYTKTQLEKVTVEQALAHPTWSMGPKITIDSSTLMNKGLEVIEAYHLFCCDFDHISVVVHPQSSIHSMVQFKDGSVKAHLGPSDMRIPIQLALSYPNRWDAPCEPVDFCKMASLEFFPPDLNTFRCLSLALEAGRQGGTAPCVLNAANEVAVGAFLLRGCGYLDIERAVEHVLQYHNMEPVESLEQLSQIDSWARAKTKEYLRV